MVVLQSHSSSLQYFQIEFECLGELEEDLEWKVTYVGSAEDQTRDQVLEEVMVGPVPQGVSKFVLTAEAPSVNLIPMKDLVGVTVVLITCSYREKEFVRIGYYVNNEYYHASPLDYQRQATQAASHHAAAASQAQASGLPPPPPLALAEGPQPASEEEIAAMLESGQIIDPAHVYRNVMSDKPRVTRFQIDWASAAQQELQHQRVRRAPRCIAHTVTSTCLIHICISCIVIESISSSSKERCSSWSNHHSSRTRRCRYRHRCRWGHRLREGFLRCLWTRSPRLRSHPFPLAKHSWGDTRERWTGLLNSSECSYPRLPNYALL